MPPVNDPLATTANFSRRDPIGSDACDVRDALPAGTRLDEFEVLCVLGAGGFGIVYLALDHALMRQVAIKEYMPSALAARAMGAWVALRGPQYADTFAAGLRSFVNEAQLLANFDHPSLVKVHRFWEDNGTAYMVMQYYPGRTLKQERGALQEPLSEAWLRALMEPMLEALDVLHREGVYHRDVSPDNILVQLEGPPVLLDFGAARKVIGDCTQTITTILKPSFAPVEQYADVAGMRQGPWTDLYALAAVAYYMIQGQPPVPAVARAVRDSQRPLAASPGKLSPVFLQALDWALAVAPEDRPQDVSQMREALSGRLKRPGTLPSRADAVAANRPRGWQWSAGFAAVLVMGTVASWGYRAQTAAPPLPPAPTAHALEAVPVVAAPRTPDAPAAADAPPATTRRRATVVAHQSTKSPRSPDEACSGRNFFSKAICVSRECASTRFVQHPQCVAQRHSNEARERGG